LGAQVVGVEKDAGASAFLQEEGYEVLPAIDSNRAYDVVCAFQVLEHLVDPDTTVGEISKVMKPDGRFLISVPNGGEAARVGATWLGFRVDLEHINYFTLDTMNRLLNSHSLYIENYWEHSQPAIARETNDAFSTSKLALRCKAFAHSIVSSPHPGDFSDQGAFVLTIIARKVATE
jgi:SAM-dependent methyltransferase